MSATTYRATTTEFEDSDTILTSSELKSAKKPSIVRLSAKQPSPVNQYYYNYLDRDFQRQVNKIIKEDEDDEYGENGPFPHDNNRFRVYSVTTQHLAAPQKPSRVMIIKPNNSTTPTENTSFYNESSDLE